MPEGKPGHNTRPHARLPPNFLGMDARMTLQLNVTLIRKLRGSLMSLAYFFDMLLMVVFITRHWLTSDRLVHESAEYITIYCYTEQNVTQKKGEKFTNTRCWIYSILYSRQTPWVFAGNRTSGFHRTE